MYVGVRYLTMDLFPDIKDESFQFLIAQRQEFRNLENPDSLYPHQEFVRRYMSPYTPYKSIILFHDLGSGKSIACIATAVDHYLHDKKECIIVTKGQSGAENFMSQIKKFKGLSDQKNKWDESIFKMRRYTSMSNQVTEMSDSNIKQIYSNKIIVLDEVHNIRFPGNNDISDCVYKSLMRIVKNCQNTKIIMATATPMTDNENQLKPLLQMCNYFKYPNKNINMFESISSGFYGTNVNENDMNDMNGIISYNPYVLDKPETCYKTKMYEGMYASCMIGHQKKYYEKHFEMGKPKDIYRSWTHLSLFCTPDGDYGKKITDKLMDKINRNAHITPVLSDSTKEISYITYSPRAELKEMLSGNNLKNCSCKYSALIDLLDSTEGNVFVFVEEVKGSGIILLSTILEANGYEMYIGENLEHELHKNQKRFTMCVGSLEICPNIQDRLDGFNSILNKDGKYVRILLGSRVIGESITLMNVRHFHCITPHWNNSTINQAIGRVVRNGSHNALDLSERTVNIYMHTAILENNFGNSIDVMKLITCLKKQENIQKQEDCMKKIAVDRYCTLRPYIAYEITEFRIFCAAYIRYHIDNIMLGLKEITNLIPGVCYDISKLSNELNINMEILSQALCIIIRDNRPFFVKDDEKITYLRAYGNAIFLVEDCSLPYVMFPPTRLHSSSFDGNIENEDQSNISISLEKFRYLPVWNKISYLEKTIENIIENINDDTYACVEKAKILSNLFAVIDGIPCHLLWYKNIESAYTTSKKMPRKPYGKTRIYVNEWKYVDGKEEQKYLEYYEKLHNDFIGNFLRMIYLRNKENIYGIISTIDGKMRIRQLNDINETKKDNRHMKRGKNISSLKISELLNIIQQLGILGVYSLRKDMIQKIDEFLIEKELYYIL